MEIEYLFRSTARAVGLMEIEHLFRYPALAVGLKPSAMRGEARLRGLERAVADYLLKDHKPPASQGEARLRGLWRIIYSKTISPRLARAKPACAGERSVTHQDDQPPFSPCGRRGRGGCAQGEMFWQAPACHLPFQASGRPTAPFSPCGRRGRGDEGQKARECRKPPLLCSRLTGYENHHH